MAHPHSPTGTGDSLASSSARVARRSLVVAHATFGATLVVLAVVVMLAKHAIDRAVDAEHEVALLETRMAALDDRMVMLTRMVATTGEGAYAAEYNARLEDMLAAAAHARTLAPPEAIRHLSGGTITRRFVALNRQVQSLGTAGRSGDALAVLRSEEYARLRTILADNFARFFVALRADTEARTHRVAMITGLSALTVLLSAFALNGFLLSRSVARAERAHGHVERTLVRSAYADPLTGLANRAAFEPALRRSADAPERTLVLAIDLNDFKPVNDTHGHAAGDTVLRVLGHRIAQMLPRAFTARIGGDEFVILMEAAGRKEAETSIERVLDRLAAPISLASGNRVTVTSCAGACWVAEASTPADAWHRADLALYEAKARKHRGPRLMWATTDTRRAGVLPFGAAPQGTCAAANEANEPDSPPATSAAQA